MNARDFLVRGLLAGLIAAFVAFGVAYVVGEPPVRAAIALEEAGGGHSHGGEEAEEERLPPVRCRCPVHCSPPSVC